MEIPEKESSLNIQIETGKYQVSLHETKDLFPDPITSVKTPRPLLYLDIGGRQDKCVKFSIPGQGDTGILDVLQKDTNCSLDGRPQEGNRLRNMVLLGFTLARKFNRSLHWITLQDMAIYYCETPKEKPQFLFSSMHDLAFHQRSYYEMRYGAVLTDPQLRTQYEIDKQEFMNPSKKPSSYRFDNVSITEELRPLYDSTTTWKQFFDNIRATYDQKTRCTLLYPWLHKVVFLIMNKHTYTNAEWTIDITQHPPLRYTVSNVYRKLHRGGGGTRKLRKGRSSSRPSVLDFSTQDWDGFIKRIHRRK